MKNILLLVSTIIFIVSCKEDDVNNTSFNPPTTYNFNNVNYSGQLDRIKMLDEIILEIDKSTDGANISSSKIKSMLENQNNLFLDPALNSSGKKLSDKCLLDIKNIVELYINKLDNATGKNTLASQGISGILTSNDNKKYFVDENGIEISEIVEKGYLTGVFANQIINTYMTNSKIGDQIDNSTVKVGEGTVMEHHWDEGFGYSGLPINYTSSTTESLKFLGKYTHSRNLVLNSSNTIFKAFLDGRYAISTKNNSIKNENAKIIIEEYQKVIAATAISYLNKTKTNFSNDALRAHNFSEALGFIIGMTIFPEGSKYKMSNEELVNLVEFSSVNTWNLKIEDIDKIINSISTKFNWDSIKSSL